MTDPEDINIPHPDVEKLFGLDQPLATDKVEMPKPARLAPRTARGLLVGFGIALLSFGTLLWIGGGLWATGASLHGDTPNKIVGLEWQTTGTALLWPGVLFIGLYWLAVALTPDPE